MAIKLTSLMPALAREMGDVDTSNLYYNANQLFSALNDGIEDANSEAIKQQYSKSGTGDAEEVSPTPSEVDKRLIILYAALALTRGEIAKAARSSIIHSNPAGRTDLSKVVDALEHQAERLEEKIEKIRLLRQQTEVEKEAEDEAWAVELKGRVSKKEVEATGIMDISYTES